MTTITLYTAERQLILLRAPVIASGDRARVELQVHADPSWTGYHLAAILFRDGERERTSEIALDSQGTCKVPPALLSEPCTLQIGLRGISRDPDTDADAACRTTSLVRLRVAEGTPAEAGEALVNPTDATADENAVLAGETFYAGEGKEARTGTIPTYEEGTPTIVAPYTESDPTVPAWAKQPQKPTYTAAEVGARPADWTPTETDPTIPDWAKQPTPPADWAKAAEKPAYGWDEIADKPFTNGKLNAACLSDGVGTGGGGGSPSVITLTSTDNLNSIKQCGWYSWGTSAPTNAPTIGTSNQNCYMRVDSHANGKSFTQTVWSENVNTCSSFVSRRIQNNTIGEWEWTNPPMLEGVEYRTTEYHMGYPVYTQLVNCGRASTKTVTLNLPLLCTQLRHCGNMNQGSMPYMSQTTFNGKENAWYYTSQNRIHLVSGDTITSGPHYMRCRIWYVKVKITDQVYTS